jgi:hypothetical protein
MAKGIFYPLLILGTLIQSYILGLIFSGAGLALVEAVWTIIKPLPAVFTDRAWLIYLVSGIPVGLLIFVYTLVTVFKGNSKKHNKQDN